jgi:hypothetical protein
MHPHPQIVVLLLLVPVTPHLLLTLPVSSLPLLSLILLPLLIPLGLYPLLIPLLIVRLIVGGAAADFDLRRPESCRKGYGGGKRGDDK